MKTFEVTLTEKQCKTLASAYRRYLVDEGGNTKEEVKDIGISEFLSYSIYDHAGYMCGEVVNLDFKLQTCSDTPTEEEA